MCVETSQEKAILSCGFWTEKQFLNFPNHTIKIITQMCISNKIEAKGFTIILNYEIFTLLFVFSKKSRCFTSVPGQSLANIINF